MYMMSSMTLSRNVNDIHFYTNSGVLGQKPPRQNPPRHEPPAKSPPDISPLGYKPPEI